MVLDINRKKAGALAVMWKSCNFSVDTNWKAALKNPEIDAVIIATSHCFLGEIFRSALHQKTCFL